MESQPTARQTAEHAVRLDPQLAEAHAVLAGIYFRYEWDFEAAEREFRRAFALDPNNLEAHIGYMHYLIARNQMQQAQDETTRALDLDPRLAGCCSIPSALRSSTMPAITTPQSHGRAYEQAVFGLLADLHLAWLLISGKEDVSRGAGSFYPGTQTFRR